MTTPQVGDRVRATLGKSRNEGTVTSVDTNIAWLKVDGATCEYTGFLKDDWQFEILPPLAAPIPDVVGTICLGTHGEPVWRDKNGWWTALYGPYSLDRAQDEYGPLVEMVKKND